MKKNLNISIQLLTAMLFDSIFGRLSSDDTLPGFELNQQLIGLSRGKTVLSNRQVINSVTGEMEDLLINKKCLASVEDLPIPGLFAWNNREEKDSIAAMRLWEVKDQIPFGSSLKGDKNGLSKYYSYNSRQAAELFGDSAADVSAYGAKLFTDIKYVEYLKVKVMDYEEFVVLARELFGWKKNPGFDGSGYAVREVLPITNGRLHCQIVAIPTGLKSQIPIAKGALDIMSREKMNMIAGEDINVILFTKDMIKTNYRRAKGYEDWTVGFTYNVERDSYPLKIMWEFTQFIEPTEELKYVLMDNTRIAIEKITETFSTRDGILNYLRKEILNATDHSGVVIELKVLAALMTEVLPENFKWIRKQVTMFAIREYKLAISSYGTMFEGRTFWVNDNLHEKVKKYFSKAIARIIGGDNDFDQVGVAYNKRLKMMVIMRYPIMSGYAVVPIPEAWMDQIEDVHPEIVEICVKSYMGLGFSRDDIADNAERIREKVRYSRWIAKNIFKGGNIGSSTILLKRAMSKFWATKDIIWLDIAKNAGAQVESGAVGIKKVVKAVKRILIPNGIKLSEEFPMVYRKFNPKEIADFDVNFGSSDIDSELFTYGAQLAHHALKNFMEESVSPRRLYVPLDKIGEELISEAFLEEIKRSVYMYNMSMAEAHKIQDENDRVKVLSRICDSLSSYGEKLTAGQIQAAISMAYENAGDQNTGSFGIHLAGSRIFEVFGISEEFSGATVAIRNKKVKHIPLKVYTRSISSMDEINGNKADFKYENRVITIGGKDYILDSKEIAPEVINSISMALPYRRKDGNISNKMFIINVETSIAA